MANTFDTSRVGGGTYELEQDANGNYKLKSVGFTQVNKLNLPDLATSDTTAATTTPKTEDKKIEVADPFLKLGTQNTGGGEGGAQDYSAIAPREAKAKEATVSELGQKTNTTYNAMTDAEKNAIATGTSGMSFKGAGATTKQYTNPEKYGMSVTSTNPMDIKEQAALGNKAQFETFMGDAVTMDGPYSMSTAKTYSTPRTIADQNKFLGRTFTNKTTGLQKVTSAISNTVENIMNNSATVAVVKGMSNAITSPEQQSINQENKTSLRNLGYQTNQQGKVIGKDGQAVSAADSVFGGMNSVSAFGDISAGAASRIETREKTIEKKGYKPGDPFFDKTQDMKKELNDQINDKVASREDKSGATGIDKGGFTNPGVNSYGPHKGGGGGPGCFIKGTLITMFDGSKKPVEQVDLGDKVAEGGNVFAAGRFLNTELYDYKGIKVSGSHMVNEDGTWMRVRDTKHGKSLGDDLNTVYVFGSENRRILINGILFTDYFEVNEQDKLIEDSEDFFNNWKDYGNDVDVDNVATLNMNYEI
jgi:predicted RNA-binding protein YlqC (UPF0109 family)